MIEAPSLQRRDDLSASLAEQMAAYERQHGPVQTLPIVTAGNKQLPFVITSQGKPKAKPSRALRQLDHKHAELNTATGLSAKTVMDRLRDHRIKRGPKMNLEAV